MSCQSLLPLQVELYIQRYQNSEMGSSSNTLAGLHVALQTDEPVTEFRRYLSPRGGSMSRSHAGLEGLMTSIIAVEPIVENTDWLEL
jgi:hypothetical protein